MRSVIIETGRLRLRNYREDDLSDLVRLVGNWEVARWVSSVPHPYSEARGREWIASVRAEHAAGLPRRFAIALNDTDCLIGGVGLLDNPERQSREPALGYWLGQPYWGNQYAREAVAAVIDYGFQTLGISSICATTDPGNAASQKVLLHCGLERVGEGVVQIAAHDGWPSHHAFAWLTHGHLVHGVIDDADIEQGRWVLS
jgi:ribosomal-protein-alanine N-acetyltransferase